MSSNLLLYVWNLSLNIMYMYPTPNWFQMQNYMRKKEQKEQREKDLREGLLLYK